MLCPHCGTALAVQLCPACAAENLPEARFCQQCGVSLEEEEAPDLANRVLCPDGACIGILNPQGECSVCGLAYRQVLAAEENHG